ncbi:MAG: PD-(D/E)XK nuclease domain-containing protein, partial [Acetatifactor sp.]|nr:PD-(D/E)XK nuclease domain-containing protein [Acetatifactor sp.]
LLEDTIAGNEEAVAKAIEETRGSEYAPTYYNDEQALRYVIKFAYIAALEQYLKVEELPSGKGIADVVYLPKRRSLLPALVVELKWNKSSEGAIRQIKERNYPAILKDYDGEIVLVGISYDVKTKAHSCLIERI